MANHRAEGRAAVRKPRSVGGTHRDSCVPGGAVKVGVVGVLATATIAAPLAAAAAGVEDSAPLPAPMAQQAPQVAPQDAAPVALPVATEDAEATVREETAAANRSQERTSPAQAAKDSQESQDAEGARKSEKDEESEGTGITVEVEEPEPVTDPATEATMGGETAAAGAAAAPGESSGSGMVRPVDGPITSGYGGRIHPVYGYYKMHNGVDIGAACGTPVRSVLPGTVTHVDYYGSAGQRVVVKHANGESSAYYHLQGYAVSVGQSVAAGQVVGYVGSTGASTGCHLHLSKLDASGNYTNPMSFLQ